MKVVFATLVLAAGLLASCKNTGGSAEMSSALEPVGREFHKQDAAKALAEARFKPGEQVMLRNTQVMVFNRNPQKYTASGDVVSATAATVVMPEGLFVRVKFEDGKTGYISESDIVDPMENFGFDYGTDPGMMPAFLTDELPAPAAAAEHGAETPAAPTVPAPVQAPQTGEAGNAGSAELPPPAAKS